MIVGENGHGKTSLIEAVLYAEVFRSFRGAADRELVRFGADGFHVQAGRVAVGYDARTRKKKITVDGAEPARIADAIGLVQGVVLSPTDVVLVAGGPRERRRFLDVLLAITVPGYVDALGRYRRALAQRLRARPGEMDAFEQVLAESGARIVAARQAWADRWQDDWSRHCEAIGERGAPRLAYVPRTEGEAPALQAAFAATREKDRTLGRVTEGPHRDELRLTLDGRTLRTYGSAGQQRTAAIALRLVEAGTLDAAGGDALLCLDDAFAELDQARSERLGAVIKARVEAGRPIVAAVPKTGDIPGVIAGLPRWTMRAGVVTT